ADALPSQQDVAARLERLELALQLQVALTALARERPVFERRTDRAARLRTVRAGGEAAPPRDLLDVSERVLEVGVPELQPADLRRVEDDSAAGEQDQLAVRCRVPAAVVVLAHLARGKHLLADEHVHERRLADTRRA